MFDTDGGLSDVGKVDAEPGATAKCHADKDTEPAKDRDVLLFG